MNAHAKIDEPLTLGRLARISLVNNGGDTEGATNALFDRLANDAPLLRTLIRDAIRDAVGMRVEQAMRNQRAAILLQTTRGPSAVIALANGVARALLDMPLANGLPLRDATREQVQEQADGYAKTAKDATHKAKWLQAIAQSVPDGMRVGDVMSDDRAAELYRETAR